jgi:hypothetical protein
MRLLSPIVGLAMLVSTVAFAESPHFGQTALALGDAKTAQTVFAPDAAKIVLHVQIVDMTEGTKLTADWIAVKTDVAPANFKIDSATTELEEDAEEATFSMSKPNAGWPVGDYKVDLSINGKVTTSVPFKVAK